MATQSRILAWRIPMDRGAWGLHSIGSHRVRKDGSDLAHIQGEIRSHLSWGKEASELQLLSHTTQHVRCSPSTKTREALVPQ